VAGASLRAALTGAAPVAQAPPIGDLLAHIVPTNALAAATADAFLPLIIFTLIFAFALTRIAPEPRRLLTGVFEALRETMLVVINWVLWLAPLGVFALALVVGARAGTAAFGALIHYVVTVSAVGIAVSVLGAVPLALLGARIGIGRFARAALPAQAVAISTQSSLASLPAMLKGAGVLGVPVSTAGLTLPIAVAIFRWTGPAMNLGVAIYVARWFGVALTPGTIAAAVVVAALTSLGSVSLPGQISFVSAIAPIAAVLGVPIAPLGLLVAVETIPDIFRTLGNVTMDLAAVATVSRSSDDPLPEDMG
jgi:Na+/H+-dicarboxylate symporter